MIDAALGLVRRLTSRRFAHHLSKNELERAERVTSKALKFIEQAPTQPALIWVHYMDPHAPYDPPNIPAKQKVVPAHSGALAGFSAISSKARAKWLTAYTREVEYYDQCLGDLIGGLKKAGLWESAVVVFWSDHGEEFWEHDRCFHGHSLYDELLHVPLLIHEPGQAGGEHRDEYVSLLDVMPTVLELCEVDPPAGLRGRSLVPLLSDGDARQVAPFRVFLEATMLGGIRKGLMTDEHKLIYDLHRDEFSLYDRRRDPEDRNNIFGAAQAPDTAAMQTDLRNWTEASLALMAHYVKAAHAEEMSPQLRNRLKALGYIR